MNRFSGKESGTGEIDRTELCDHVDTESNKQHADSQKLAHWPPGNNLPQYTILLTRLRIGLIIIASSNPLYPVQDKLRGPIRLGTKVATMDAHVSFLHDEP